MNKRIGTLRALAAMVALSAAFLAATGCESLAEAMKPTAVERVAYKPEAKPAWKGQTIFIDFDVNTNVWGSEVASELSFNIRDTLVEKVVEDKIFHVQDKNTGAKYMYRIWIVIADPVITASRNGVIQGISATFRIKTYDKKGNLVTAKTREERYKAPAFTVATGDSQRKLLNDFAHNAAEGIRQTMYESLK